ncbi:MAG: sulfatase-like hydrolase/transferase [Eudoraea sp.]|nr:sulfatase-like hydrolase/transferase [Eudoraea sp.]
MSSKTNISSNRRDLKDFIRLSMAFFCGLVMLSVYQNIRLYSEGVLDSVFTNSLFLLLLHHVGFTAIISLVLAFVFTYLEKKRPSLGFITAGIIFLVVLVCEGLLIDYYVQYYEILGTGFYDQYTSNVDLGSFLIAVIVLLILGASLLRLFYSITKSYYTIISRMYPFTIILFSLFLATLILHKNPINENKTQYLVQSVTNNILDFNKYAGDVTYPLLKPYATQSGLSPYFELNETKPDIVFIIMDGVGSDFVGKKAPYKEFMPYLNSLIDESLYWPNHISNTGESVSSIPSILGSLPFGDKGFTNIKNLIRRNTLYGVLKDNGYRTSFYFGGNSALERLDKFLYEDQVDVVLDRKGFDSSFQRQEEDAAGNSLGYADKDLFLKWHSDFIPADRARMDVFLTQSTKSPFIIPEQKKYLKKSLHISLKESINKKNKRLIRKNKEVFASFLYADEAIESFISAYRAKPTFKNTIFIITGSHNLSELPQDDPISRYRVPLFIYSPLLKETKVIPSLVSHADILPSITGLLDSSFDFKVPNQVAWLGQGLVHKGMFKNLKEIPLFRHKNNIQEFIKGSYCISDNTVYKLNSSLQLTRTKKESSHLNIRGEFAQFKAINTYVTSKNKIVPDDEVSLEYLEIENSRSEMVWINSVFNGNDYDNAYKTARDLAFDGEKERALLLCRYILKEVPGHADTEILMGRIYAWNKEYDKAASILETAIEKYPVYEDGYAALLDVYYWSEKNQKVREIKTRIKKHNIRSANVRDKIKRAEEKLKKEQPLFESENIGFLNFENDDY